jgi:hypothetical protein
VASYVYFAVTVYGGVSLVLVTRAAQCLRLLRQEPEWVTFAAPILAASAVGSADLWRYLAFLLPLVVVLFARLSATWTRDRAITLCCLAAAATWLTQRPFASMDLVAYFRDWFPYYAVLDRVPIEGGVQLWPRWVWMFLATIMLAWALAPGTLGAHGVGHDAESAPS